DLIDALVARRFGIGLECLPDHGRTRIIGRRAFEYALARAPIDPDHAHAFGRQEWPAVPPIARFLHELLEDRRRHAPPLHIAAHVPRLIETDIDPGDDVRRSAHEPRLF